jgi:CRISPR-associated protein Cmr5
MKNLEQIRARNADKAVSAGNFTRNDVNGLPARVRSCGLLATAAFVSVTGQTSRTEMWNAMDAVAKHLLDPEIGRLTRSPQGIETATKAMLKELSESDSARLIAATAEAIAYLSYLKRFAPKQ